MLYFDRDDDDFIFYYNWAILVNVNCVYKPTGELIERSFTFKCGSDNYSIMDKELNYEFSEMLRDYPTSPYKIKGSLIQDPDSKDCYIGILTQLIQVEWKGLDDGLLVIYDESTKISGA